MNRLRLILLGFLFSCSCVLADDRTMGTTNRVTAAGQGTALGNDYSEMNRAFTNYFASLDVIVKTLPSVNSATGTAKLIDAWSEATETLCAAGENFAKNHPEIYTLPKPPPEFVAVFAKIDRLETDYAALPEGIGKLTNQFLDAPEVQKAIKRFKKSLDRVANIGRIPKERR